ncbi:MAG: RHS repeat-associated core domain-containing protein, partial [Clostridia bacterium]|nr:RHS repeat-associated core domain-containing protein [Clostridia bacterium]
MVKHNGVMYGYTDSNLKDKLTVFDNATYTYDSIGNLTNDGWWTYTWEAGRQLKKLSHGTGADLAEIEFTYNHAGIRTKKVKKLGCTVTGTTEYILNGDKVVEQIFTDHVQNTVDVLHFYYDAQGKPAMVKHGSNMYGYVYNLQGDVLGLLDNSGSAVAEYGYDVWGMQGAEVYGGVGALNPFRYRGYIYDLETGMYYLKSRYYIPQVGRFISADSVTLQGLPNLFRYCEDNPVRRIDKYGN